MTAKQGISPASHIHHILWALIDWVYTPRCAGCGQLNQRWCSDCVRKITPIDHDLSCPVCDYPSVANGICPDCSNYQPHFNAIRSYAIYTDPFRKTIHCLKYHRDIGLSETLASYLHDLLETTNWQPELVVAVPLSPQRQRQRGYNQSALLAKNLSWLIHLPYAAQALLRVKDTNSQVGLDGLQRHANVKHAFSAEYKICAQKKVLLVDDVATTGATLSSCAKALLDAGATHIYGLTLARAIHLDLS
jgi:competence protein ComFC